MAREQGRNSRTARTRRKGLSLSRAIRQALQEGDEEMIEELDRIAGHNRGNWRARYLRLPREDEEL